MNKEGRGAVPSITIQPDLAIERVLTLEIVRVTERAAVAAARLTGRGNEKAADQAAVNAMRRELNNLPINGTIVIGEGERDEAPMLFIGETVGNKNGPAVDIAGVLHTADPADTGIDIYMGIGGAPEGVLAAAALRCIGGQMQCRLVLDTAEKRERAAKMGIKDPRKKYEIGDLVKGDCLFAATGVTNGALLTGVRFRKDVIETETVVMRSITGTVRWIRGEHRQLEKSHLD